MPRYMVRLDTATGRYWEARLDDPGTGASKQPPGVRLITRVVSAPSVDRAIRLAEADWRQKGR